MVQNVQQKLLLLLLLLLQVICRGKILYEKTQQRQDGILTTLHIRITSEMSPSFRLLVYYVKGNEEIVADSVWIDVVDQCQNPVSSFALKEIYTVVYGSKT